MEAGAIGGAVIVGVDLKPGGDAALLWALEQAAERSLRLYLVHVMTQTDLDATGALSLAEKRELVLQDFSRRMTGHTQKLAQRLLMERGVDADLGKIDISLEPRIVEGHRTQMENRVADILAQVAADYEVSAVALGRRGRPDSVADHLKSVCRSTDQVGEFGSLLYVLSEERMSQKSQTWASDE